MVTIAGKRIFLVLALSLFCASAASAASSASGTSGTSGVSGTSGASAAEVIHRFDSLVRVAKDGTLTVTETISVRAEGRAIKRGIYRDFPLTFRDAGGRVREVSFSLIDVTRDGKPEPYFTRRQRGGIRIYAGKKDVLLRRGDHTYVIRYRTGRQIRWFDGKAELNWNVTGNFWRFPIQAASYRLELIDGQRPLRWTAFTGRRGARGTDWRGSIDNNGVLTVETTRPLSRGEGLTVVAALPAGAVNPPSAATLFWYDVRDNRHWIFGGLGFVLVLVYYLVAWRAVGRDPAAGTIIPLFRPPKGISPGLANYVHKWGFARDKWRAFTAAALSLAVHGLIRFKDKDGTLSLEAIGSAPEGGIAKLPPGERAIVTWLAGQGGYGEITRANGSAVAKLGTSFTKSIEDENKHRFFRRNLGFVIAGVVLTALAVVGVIAFGGLGDEDILILVLFGFFGVMFGIFLLPVLTALFGPQRFRLLLRNAMSLIVLGVMVTIFLNFVRAAFPGGFGRAVPLLWSVVAGYPFPFVLITAFATLNGLFLYLLRAPTALGRPIMDQLSGLRLYLETAESDRLNMRAPEITSERFEALLPYAVALDVEKPWSEAFESALRRAHPGDADPMRYYQPHWHSGSSFSSGNFSSAMSSTVGDFSGAFASAVPVSSGSSGFSSGGGGGGSGGGGGGGGGGGW